MLRLITASIAGAALLALSVPAAAAGNEGTVNGWDYGPFTSGDGCYVAKVVDGEVMIGFHQMADSGEFRIAFSNEDWDQLAPLINKDVPVTVTLATPSGKRQLTSKEGVVLQISGGVEAVVAVWFSGEAAETRRAFRTARSVTLTVGDTEIGTYPLTGLPEGIDALGSCASSLGG